MEVIYRGRHLCNCLPSILFSFSVRTCSSMCIISSLPFSHDSTLCQSCLNQRWASIKLCMPNRVLHESFWTGTEKAIESFSSAEVTKFKTSELWLSMFPDLQIKDAVNVCATSEPLVKAFPEAQLENYSSYGLVVHLFLSIPWVSLLFSS